MKKTKRKAFNFLRSYFDVLNELEKDSDKLSFLTSIINKQFLNEDPNDLKFIAKLCYESQRHSIESSVKGWIRANNTDLQGYVLDTPRTDPPTNPPTNPKEEEGEEEVQGEEEEKEQVEYTKVLEIFNSVCKRLPKIKKISPARKKLIDARAKEYDLQTIGLVLTKASNSDFLNGVNANGWTANFDWIFNTNNFIKILEDNYINKEKNKNKPVDAAEIIYKRHGINREM